GGRYGLQEGFFGKIAVRTSGTGDVWLRYGPSRPERFIHAADVLTDRFDREKVAGRIVLVGVSAPSLGDQWPSPLGSTMPGVEILAQEVEQMLQGELLSQPNWMIGAEFMAAVAASALMVAFSSLGRAWAISTGSAAISLTVILSVLGYARWHVLIDPIWPALMLAMVTFGATLIQKRARNEGQSA